MGSFAARLYSAAVKHSGVVRENKQTISRERGFNDEAKSCDVGEKGDNEGEFRIVRRERRKRSPIIHGSSNDTSLKGVLKMNHFHVYRLDPSVTPADVAEHLKQKGLDGVLCERLQAKYPDIYSSFKVSCTADQVEKLKEPSLWPTGTCINTFFHWIKKKDIKT